MIGTAILDVGLIESCMAEGTSWPPLIGSVKARMPCVSVALDTAEADTLCVKVVYHVAGSWGRWLVRQRPSIAAP